MSRQAQCMHTLPIMNQQSIHISNRLQQPSLMLIETWLFSLKLHLEPKYIRGSWLDVCHIYLFVDQREVRLLYVLYILYEQKWLIMHILVLAHTSLVLAPAGCCPVCKVHTRLNLATLEFKYTPLLKSLKFNDWLNWLKGKVKTFTLQKLISQNK